jgi:hypothetical protein
MNRYFLLTYMISAPFIALTVLYELGSAHVSSGFPFVWVNCLLILSNAPPFYGQCGYYYDWFAYFSRRVVLYGLGLRATRLLQTAATC